MSITKLQDGRYQWRHRVGGKHLKKTFATRRDAAAHDSRVRADLARGVHVDMSNRVTVAEYARAWSDARVVRRSTREFHDAILRNHIEATPLGARPLVSVRPSEVQSWVTGRAALVGPAYLRKLVMLLRAVCAAAVLDGVISRNPVQPAARLSLPKNDKAKFIPLTIPQVCAWADGAVPRLRAMILTQAGLGLRIGELRGLRVQDVDFLRRAVSISEQSDRWGQRAPLKTTGSRRSVPLPAVTAGVLAAHIRQFPPAANGTIFTSGKGVAWSQSAQGVAYQKAAAAAGLPDGTSSHDLRHHYVSVLLDAGESVHAVAERIGDSAEMVLRVYGHLMPDREDTTRKAVDAAWKAAGDQAAEGTL